MEHDIESRPQDIGRTECANQIIATMAKHMLEAEKVQKSLCLEVVTNVVYTLN